MVRPELEIQRVLPSDRGWPLHDVAGTRIIETNALAGLPEFTLMARAGTCLARLAMAIAPRARTAWVACGPGNNGGDGLVAAAELARSGWRVQATVLAGERDASAEATRALACAREAGVSIAAALPTAPTADLIIDALLGIGARRAPEGALAASIALLNGCRSGPVVAADLPSGLAADTGSVLGSAAVVATHTLAMLTLKPGLFMHHGRDHAGTVWLAPLGVDIDTATPARLVAPPPPASRGHAQHKGSFGDVRVVGGAPGMAGAAILCARAALAAGAGRVYLTLLDPAAAALDPARPELMLRPLQTTRAADQLAGATVACGCGGGAGVAALLPAVVHHAGQLVLDADALNAIAASAALQAALRARHGRGLPTVLTPHPLEAARLLDCPVQQVQADRIAAARDLARSLRSTVLLKGSGSVIASPLAGAPVFVNPTGSARLGTAGTGDVLAGWLAGSWSAHAGTDPAETASDAAWLHGRAADLAPGGGALRATDLIECMVAVPECAAVLLPRPNATGAALR